MGRLAVLAPFCVAVCVVCLAGADSPACPDTCEGCPPSVERCKIKACYVQCYEQQKVLTAETHLLSEVMSTLARFRVELYQVTSKPGKVWTMLSSSVKSRSF